MRLVDTDLAIAVEGVTTKQHRHEKPTAAAAASATFPARHAKAREQAEAVRVARGACLRVCGRSPRTRGWPAVVEGVLGAASFAARWPGLGHGRIAAPARLIHVFDRA